MKRSIAVLLVCVMLLPGLSLCNWWDGLDCESKAEVLTEQLIQCETECLVLAMELAELKIKKERNDQTARYISGTLGVFGIFSFATGGGAYALVTGSLFLYGAISK